MTSVCHTDLGCEGGGGLGEEGGLEGQLGTEAGQQRLYCCRQETVSGGD